MNIQDFKQKINSWLADDAVFLSLLVTLVGTASFGLGRQSSGLESTISDNSMTGNVIEPLNREYLANESTNSVENAVYVGSKNSDKYHLPWCSGAKRIVEANKVTFTSKEEAEAAGYKPAANCPGI